jgi:virginiamycin B lyase
MFVTGTAFRPIRVALLLSLQSFLFAQAPLSSTQYVLPSPRAQPQSITPGPDGALWFTEAVGGKVGRITPSGNITEYDGSVGSSAFISSITSGPDGALWFGGNLIFKIGRITTSGSVTLYSTMDDVDDITTGPDGALWFTEYSNARIGRITTSGVYSNYPVPVDSRTSPQFGGITPGPDGALWFLDNQSKKIGRITTAGSLTEYDVPNASLYMKGITAGPDGALWFADTQGHFIGRITTSGVITEYPVVGSPRGITVGPDRALWFGNARNSIGRITTDGVITTYAVVAGDTSWITKGFDGALWYADYVGNEIGRAVPPAVVNRAGVLSHIAAGGAWTTVITLVNTSSAAVPVTVALHNDDGSALSLPVTTTQQGSTQTTTTASVNATMNPNTTLLISMGDQVASTVVGWADVTSSGSLGGYAIFRQNSPNGSPSEGTVPLQTQSPSTITLPFDNTAGFTMGVALANLSTSSANITATIWDDSGTQLGTQNITVAGSGHTSFVLPTQIALTSGKRGIVRFQSTASGGIAGLGIRFSPFAAFTSVPVILTQ